MNNIKNIEIGMIIVGCIINILIFIICKKNIKIIKNNKKINDEKIIKNKIIKKINNNKIIFLIMINIILFIIFGIIRNYE